MAIERPKYEKGPTAESLHMEMQQIIKDRSITTLYQPILSLKDGKVFGYEALTRGPEASPLYAPLPLFEQAERSGLLYSLDRLAREKAIQDSLAVTDKELLFLNLSARILQDPLFMPGRTLELLERRGLRPCNVVFEITERDSIGDFAAAQRILDHYRSQGYRIAVDDAGAGYSSLQAVAELQPDFIKADRSLVKDLHLQKKKEYIVETLLEFAQKLNIDMIAEGIEKTEELMKLTRMGVHFGQGFLLGRPGRERTVLTEDLRECILTHRRKHDTTGSTWAIGDLASPCAEFKPTVQISEVAGYFKQNIHAQGAAIVSEGVPIGLIMRERLFQQLAGQYGFSLFWNRSIDQLMDPRPLIVDELTPVEQVSQLATSRDIQNLYDLVLITRRGSFTGAASIRSILECITNARMESAKVASPLTGLPGNIQIHRELNKRLTEGRRFSVIYADLDFFKWYNDRYGFQKGDQLIQFTADCIQQAIGVLGKPHDFVGHIGGDDFIAITSCDDPEKLCGEVIRRFEQGVPLFYEKKDWSYVEDRSGNRIESTGVTISLSLIVCGQAGQVTADQISQAAAKLKKLSKQAKGSIFCSDYLEAAYSNNSGS